MDCNTARMNLGAYLDGELPDGEAARLRKHVETCQACSAELDELRALIGKLETADAESPPVPASLWDAIEARLEHPVRPVRSLRLMSWMRRPLAMAASVAFLIGSAVFLTVWLSPTAQVAQATVVDYSILLDGVASDVERAFQRFTTHYGGQRVDPASVAECAPGLRFALPAEMAGGFRRQEVYTLRFGDAPGVAARYTRGQEPLFVFFHPPVDKELLGVHRESDCHVAGRPGYCVETGPWRLIHFTDPTTCHCILSTLADSELDAVMAAVSPDFHLYSGNRSH